MSTVHLATDNKHGDAMDLVINDESAEQIATALDNPISALSVSRTALEEARDRLRTQVAKDAAELKRLQAFLRDARAELRRTERLLVALDRVENPRRRKETSA